MTAAFGGLAVICVLISLGVFFGQAGALSLFARFFVLIIGITSAFLAFIEFRKYRSLWVLDISGTADIRASVTSRATRRAAVETSRQLNEIHHLAAGTLLTPILLLLRLADSHDDVNTVLIFPDSVSPDAFRRLSLACRWHAAQRLRRTKNIL